MQPRLQAKPSGVPGSHSSYRSAVHAQAFVAHAARSLTHAFAASVLLFSSLQSPTQLAPPAALAAQGLSVEQKLVAEAWKLTDKEYVDRSFSGQDWFKRRQGMVKKSYPSTADAYAEIRTMLSSLGDKYTRFLTPPMYDALFSQATGDVAGIGVELMTQEATVPGGKTAVLINSVVPEGPADRSGVLTGDVVVDVDSNEVGGLSAEEVAARVRGPAGSKLRLVLEREGSDEPSIKLIERAAVKLDAVTSQLSTISGQKTGIVRIKAFSTATAADVRSALEKLLTQKPQLLVLDLRGNTGGYFPGGIDVARLLLPKDAIITYVTDRSLAEVSYNNLEDGLDTITPLYVLVDARTASASEILASALQDNNRAKLVGKTTYGKAVIQNVARLSDGSAVVVTTARYETPKRTKINKLGIQVNIEKDCPVKVGAAECLPGVI
uniref:PDZ domain-containing protein n=1 Tax=Coccolithus braarudii TaxID=221442 RepID=A0A7S0LFN1_9EUKA